MFSRLLRPRGVPHGWNVNAAVTLQQTLMGDSQEWKSVQIILIIHFPSLGETGIGIARSNQADQHAIHVDLVSIRRGSAANLSAVGKHRINRSIDRDDVAREAVLNWDRPAQVDG